MALVKSSRSKPYATKSTTAEGEAPEHVQSEGEILIKEMVKKQLDTQLSLNLELSKKKDFERSAELEPLAKYFSGQTSLKEFEECTSRAAREVDLQLFGLTSEETGLLEDRDKGEEFFTKKYKNVEGSILLSRLKQICSKIQETKSRKLIDVEEYRSKIPSRHDLELAASVKPQSEHSRLYQFALSCQPTAVDSRPLTHPINQLKDLEQELFSHLDEKPRRRKRKFKKQSDEIPSTSSYNDKEGYVVDDTNSDKRPSLWDVTTSDQVSSQKCSQERVYGCKKEVLYTVKDKKIVPVNSDKSILTNKKIDTSLHGKKFVVSNVEENTDSAMQMNTRLSVEKIREIPRFANYNPGAPSKTLYIKNLHNNLKEDDLVNLFRQYECPGEPRIIYRLMTGKMKGQAFIAFSDIKKATAALDSTNGCFLSGKPVIIQFGKSNL